MPAPPTSTFRPPAVPLITHDPYFSIWSNCDHLSEGMSVHWTGALQPLFGYVRIDGVAYRFLGGDISCGNTIHHISLEVLPTCTIYRFEVAGIRLTVTFTSPLLADDLDLLSRPASYVSWDVQALDGLTHDVAVYFSVTSSLAIDSHDDEVQWARYRFGASDVLAASAAEQRVLAHAGDNQRIEWGTLYLATSDEAAELWIGELRPGVKSFVTDGTLPEIDELDMPCKFRDGWPSLHCVSSLGMVGTVPVSGFAVVAYDDRYSIEYLQRKLRPYWRRNGASTETLLHSSLHEYASIIERCRQFDDEFMDDLRRAGGERYAQLCALAYRQAIAAHKLCADIDGTPLFFSKENFSNGCIATVDVTYPSSPLFLLLNPELLKGMTTPIFEYASLPRWRFPFAPHDLGTYPLANGQVYGGGEVSEEDQMPVEECGNMLLLTAAIARAEGHAKYASRYWSLVSQWANYLRDKGLNPENQLCTDDFAGHIAGNTNLSVKAILALGAYAQLAEQLGEQGTAKSYRRVAEEMAAAWTCMADDGDHYRLTFDLNGTWSQKYNLVWDHLLGLHLFPKEVPRKEIAYYLAQQNQFGVPLDNRKTYTKLDWIVWSATLAENDEDFRALVNPLYDWVNTTPDRVPLTDWYDTLSGAQVGFQARSVVGGLYIKLLYDDGVWQKWLNRIRQSSVQTIA